MKDEYRYIDSKITSAGKIALQIKHSNKQKERCDDQDTKEPQTRQYQVNIPITTAEDPKYSENNPTWEKHPPVSHGIDVSFGIIFDSV